MTKKFALLQSVAATAEAIGAKTLAARKEPVMFYADPNERMDGQLRSSAFFVKYRDLALCTYLVHERSNPLNDYLQFDYVDAEGHHREILSNELEVLATDAEFFDGWTEKDAWVFEFGQFMEPTTGGTFTEQFNRLLSLLLSRYFAALKAV